MYAEKTIVFGLDGAHFELLEPWLEEGELPNINRAIGNGATADMESVLPPVTSPNWKAYATGKNPGKLGIFWWENVDMADERVYYPDERKAAHTEFWEIIGEHSSAGVVNVPTTYPPREVEPFIVSGAPDAEESGFTHPDELANELRAELDYRIIKNKPLKTSPDEAASEIHDLIDLRFRTGKYLLERYDPEFLQITTFYLNSLHHYFWDDDRTLEAWKIIDDHLGDFLEEDFNVVLMSDHGATEIHTVFHINTWLEREGYLRADMGVTGILGSLGITTDRLLELTSKLNIRSTASRIVPQRILNGIPSEGGEVSHESKMSNLNWEQTLALASSQGPVYVDKNTEDYDQIRDELIKALSDLRTPADRKVIKGVFRGEEVYHGPYEEEAPDIVVDQADGIHIQGGLGREEVFTQPEEDGWRGENKRHALFVASGPDFETGAVEDLSILDLAPTMLHLHGCAIPSDMDGEVATSVFESGSPANEREVTQFQVGANETISDESAEESAVQERLDDLGYL
jgi:predicted AlkP superfamily phosphohydrolase/phosphomutase